MASGAESGTGGDVEALRADALVEGVELGIVSAGYTIVGVVGQRAGQTA